MAGNAWSGGKQLPIPKGLLKGQGFKPAPGRPPELEGPPRRAGIIQLYAPETAVNVIASYVEPPQVVAERARNGAWTEIPRQKLRSLSGWVGPQLVKVECNLRFTAERVRSVGDELRALRSMQDRLVGLDVPTRPPYIRLVGYVPGHYANVRWQIDDLAIQEEDFEAGQVVRAAAKVTLVEWVSSDITTKAPAERRPAKTKEWRKGDTLQKFAKRHLGANTQTTRRALREANPQIKAWTKIEPGRKIKIPASSLHWQGGGTTVARGVTDVLRKK